jgi:hypothetical protein
LEYFVKCSIISDRYKSHCSFTMMSKDVLNWNIVMEKNVGECLNILKNYDWKELKLSNEINDFILNISSNHHCNSKVLLYSILSGIGHFAERANVINMETKQVKPISVYEVLIAPSGMYNNNRCNRNNCLFLGVEKSKYINVISNSCSKVERYIYDEYYKKRRSFIPDGGSETSQELCDKNKNIKSFDCWINHFGSVKQVYTTPSLLQILIETSVFFLANEGDAILQESSFYNPSDPTADIKQAALIDCKSDSVNFYQYYYLVFIYYVTFVF